MQIGGAGRAVSSKSDWNLVSLVRVKRERFSFKPLMSRGAVDNRGTAFFEIGQVLQRELVSMGKDGSWGKNTIFLAPLCRGFGWKQVGPIQISGKKVTQR
jgi:hypothetical protein